MTFVRVRRGIRKLIRTTNRASRKLARRVHLHSDPSVRELEEAGTSESPAFIKAKQKSFSTPQAVIDTVIHRAVGSSTVGIERIMKGVDNEVYAVETAGGDQLVVKISRNEESGSRLGKERWAIEQCAKAEIPVSQIVSLDTIEFEDKPLGILIQTKLPGIPLDEMLKDNRSENNTDELFRKAGSILSRVNSIETNGFGELDRNGNGEYDSIGKMFSPAAFDKAYCIEVAHNVDLEEEIIERALEELYDCQTNYPKVPARLIHNDFAPRHLLIRDTQISGIVDFEDAQGGDPAREFARWEFFFEHRYPLDGLKEGYENSAIFRNDFERRLHLWKLHTGLGQLVYCYRQEFKRGIELCKDRLTKDVARF